MDCQWSGFKADSTDRIGLLNVQLLKNFLEENIANQKGIVTSQKLIFTLWLLNVQLRRNL